MYNYLLEKFSKLEENLTQACLFVLVTYYWFDFKRVWTSFPVYYFNWSTQRTLPSAMQCFILEWKPGSWTYSLYQEPLYCLEPLSYTEMVHFTVELSSVYDSKEELWNPCIYIKYLLPILCYYVLYFFAWLETWIFEMPLIKVPNKMKTNIYYFFPCDLLEQCTQ